MREYEELLDLSSRSGNSGGSGGGGEGDGNNGNGGGNSSSHSNNSSAADKLSTIAETASLEGQASSDNLERYYMALFSAINRSIMRKKHQCSLYSTFDHFHSLNSFEGTRIFKG